MVNIKFWRAVIMKKEGGGRHKGAGEQRYMQIVGNNIFLVRLMLFTAFIKLLCFIYVAYVLSIKIIF